MHRECFTANCQEMNDVHMLYIANCHEAQSIAIIIFFCVSQMMCTLQNLLKTRFQLACHCDIL